MAAHRKVSISWKAKAVAFNLFDRMPLGEQMYYRFQKDITRSLPRDYETTNKSASAQINHARNMIDYFERIAEIKILEIGAGWDLYANLIYWCYGIEEQFAIDLRRWARAETVNAAIRHLSMDPPPGAVRTPQQPVNDGTFDSDLKELYGIDYLAPLDLARAPINPNSIDCIITTSVFEHVPTEALSEILREFRKLIKIDGMMSHIIDYSDHYCHADSKINDFNYLRFSTTAWKKYNPGIHFQNRLRTKDFLSKFIDAGFDVVAANEWFGRPSQFNSVKVHREFSHYEHEELLAIGCHFIAHPASRHCSVDDPAS